MRTAVCCLIERSSLSKLPFHNKPVIDEWQSVIDECLTHVEPEIQTSAVAAIPPFFSEFYITEEGEVLQHKQESVLTNYLKELKSPLEATRQGHASALGCLPGPMLQGQLGRVLGGLIQVTVVTECDAAMAEARRDAVRAIAGICCTVGVHSEGRPDQVLCFQNLATVYSALFTAAQDYTLDSRGDIGAWVREAAMTAMCDLHALVVTSDPQLLTPDLTAQVVTCLAQQAVEKIDRTRSLAGHLFSRLLHHDPPIPHIPHFEEVKVIFPKVIDIDSAWSADCDTYVQFSRLLGLPRFTHSVLQGLLVSVGGLTESVVKFSSASLLDYLKSLGGDPDKLGGFMGVFLDVCRQHSRDDRVTLPALKTLDHMLSWGVLDPLASDDSESVPQQLVAMVKAEVAKCGRPHKIMAAADVYCGLLQFEGATRARCLQQLLILLCHKYPRVRKTTSDKLYEALLTYDDVIPEDHEADVMTALSDTTWDGQDVSEIREQRNLICDMLGVSRPVLMKKQP